MDLREQLIKNDPVAREPGLDAFHADVMRQRMLMERVEREDFSRAGTRAWLRPVAVAGALAACLVAGVSIGLRMSDRQPIPPAAVVEPATRQLQFATPGGTRIIWTFHQEFDL